MMTTGVMTGGVAPIMMVVRTTRMTIMEEGGTTLTHPNTNPPSKTNLACCPQDMVCLVPAVAEVYPLFFKIGVAMDHWVG